MKTKITYSDEVNQLVSSETSFTGSFFKSMLTADSIVVIPAGTVLCYSRSLTKFYFQNLSDIEVSDLKDNDLIGYEPGSIVGITTPHPPSLVFRYLRLPTKLEVRVYNRRKIV